MKVCHLINLHIMLNIFITQGSFVINSGSLRRLKAPKFPYRILLSSKNIKSTSHCRTVKRIFLMSFQHNKTIKNTSKWHGSHSSFKQQYSSPTLLPFSINIYSRVKFKIWGSFILFILLTNIYCGFNMWEAEIMS